MAQEYRIIMFYMLFIGFLTFIIGLGGPTLLENPPPSPTLPTEAPGILDYLGFVFNNIAYFFTILLITSTTFPLLGIFIFAMTVSFLYLLLRLIRGGG